MADENRARHAFGSETRISEALAAGTIDAYDILFLDEKKVGWVTKNGEVVIAEGKQYVVNVDELPKTDGDENVVYIYNNEGYIWDSVNGQCIPMSKSADLSALEEEIATKVDEATVDSKIETAINKAVSVEIVEF